MSRIYIPFIKSDFRIPLIYFTLGGKDMVAMVDTGSESTLFNQDIPASENFVTEGTGYVMNLIGLSGETAKQRIFGATATIEVQDEKGETQSLSVEGILTDLSYVSKSIGERSGNNIDVNVIIGSDYMSENKATIDYKRRRLSIIVK